MTLLSIQYLRGTAALMVVYFHVAYQWSRVSGSTVAFPASIGSSGVDIFFVISGLIMWITTASGGVGPVEFMRKRCTRIVPIYWLLTLLVTVIALARPELLSTTRFDLAHVLASFLFIPWQHPHYASEVPLIGFAPVIIPGWTLNLEMAFYFLFSAFLLMPLSKRFISITSTLVFIVVVGYLLEPKGRGAIYTNPIILEFCFGIIIGRIYTSRFQMPLKASYGLLLGGWIALLLMSALTSMPRIVAWGIPAALIVAGFILVEKHGRIPEIAPLRLLGDASYSVYLTHIIALPIATKIWIFASGHTFPQAVQGTLAGSYGLVFAGFGFLVAVTVGITFYKFVERPFTNYFRQRSRNGKALLGPPSEKPNRG